MSDADTKDQPLFLAPAWPEGPTRAERDAALAALFEGGVAGIAEVDVRTGRFLEVNPRFCEIARRSEVELLGMGPRDLYLPQERDALLAERDTALSNGGVWRKEVRHVLGDGEIAWIQVGVSISRRDPVGAPLRTAAVIQNVTHRVAAGEKLRLSEEILRLGQVFGGIATFVRDLKTDVIACNAESRAMMGLPLGAGELPVEVWMSAILAEDRPRLLSAMTAALARRESEIAYEFRVRRPGEDEVRHFEMRARYFYDEQGQPLRSIGVAIDVTQHKRAVEKLRISEEMLRLGQQAAGIATFTRDLVSQTLAINADSRELLGFPPGDAPLTLEDWLQAVLPEDREHVAKTIAAAIARRDPFLALEYGIRRPSDGATRYVDVRCRYSYDPDGQPMRSIAVSIDVTERRLAANRLAHAARHDALTGLPNRGVLHERLCEALARSRRGERFAVMCLDLDRFKEVNDTLGHAVGDRLLVAATQRIAATLRETDTLARLGGDEFVVVQTKVVGPNDAAALAQRIVATVSEPYAFEGQKALVGVSVGIALGPADGSEGGDLLRAADMALYRAKGEGRGRYAFFTAEMNARMQTRRSMQMDLATALERREFELHYQPIVQVASRRIAGFEALIRWRRGAAGLTPPDQFISLCEETGLIGPIGAWVLETAAREAAGWGDGLTIAVNLSPLQFAASRVEADVAAALAASGLPPARLEIEITESAVLQETEATLATLARMKARGIRIAMDDFGAGYSSLSYLQRFPFDRVKIDRGFTQQVARSRKSHAIVKAMTELCDALQMSTTAEGVETEAQLQAVARIGCQDAQGYLFSRPVPAAEIPGLLAKFGVAGPSALAAE